MNIIARKDGAKSQHHAGSYHHRHYPMLGKVPERDVKQSEKDENIDNPEHYDPLLLLLFCKALFDHFPEHLLIDLFRFGEREDIDQLNPLRDKENRDLVFFQEIDNLF